MTHAIVAGRAQATVHSTRGAKKQDYSRRQPAHLQAQGRPESGSPPLLSSGSKLSRVCPCALALTCLLVFLVHAACALQKKGSREKVRNIDVHSFLNCSCSQKRTCHVFKKLACHSALGNPCYCLPKQKLVLDAGP